MSISKFEEGENMSRKAFAKDFSGLRKAVEDANVTIKEQLPQVGTLGESKLIPPALMKEIRAAVKGLIAKTLKRHYYVRAQNHA